MAQQEKIYYLTKEQYNTLWNNGSKDGSFEHGGTTYTYEENATYYVKEEGGEYLPLTGGRLTGALGFYNNSGQLGLQLDYWGLDLQSDNGTLESFISRMPGGVYINNGSMGVVNFDKLSFLTARSDSNSSTFGYGLEGQVLMTNGQGYNNLYWGTVSGGGSTKLYTHFVSLYKSYYYDGNEREVVSIRYLSTDKTTPLTLSGVATQVHNSSCGGDQLVGIFEQYDEVNYEDSLLSLRPVGVDLYTSQISIYDNSENWFLWQGQPVKIVHSVREFK